MLSSFLFSYFSINSIYNLEFYLKVISSQYIEFLSKAITSPVVCEIADMCVLRVAFVMSGVITDGFKENKTNCCIEGKI